MRRAALGWATLLLAAGQLPAQQVAISAGYALADYREQASFLHFKGNGPTGTLAFNYGRVGLTVDGSHLAFDPAIDDPPLEAFTVDQISARVAVRAVSLVAVEAGFFRRSVAPGRAAQSYSAATLGLRADYDLAPGANVALRTAYVAGMDFSGGGSAPFGIELGLTAGYALGKGRLRVTGDYQFQRIDRRTDQDGVRMSVPIQSSIGRLGLGVGF
jgi:hypothetical protein